jgi:hypothetical protein
MNATKARNTIESLCDREDLSVDEIKTLHDARRAIASATEIIEAHGRTWEISHHVHTDGSWSLRSWRSGTGCYAGLTPHGDAMTSRDAVLALIESDFAAGRYYR